MTMADEKLTPQRYREILDGVELRSILLKSLKASVNHQNFTDELQISVDSDAAYIPDEKGFRVESRYVLTARNRQRKVVLKVDCVYELDFSSLEEITDKFFEIYREISLPLNVWPFFRELVNSLTARMNLPPVTLPLLKS